MKNLKHVGSSLFYTEGRLSHQTIKFHDNFHVFSRKNTGNNQLGITAMHSRVIDSSALKKDSGLGRWTQNSPQFTKEQHCRGVVDGANFLSICKQVCRKLSLRIQVQPARMPEHFQVDAYQTPDRPLEARACKILVHCQRHATPPLQTNPTTAITEHITHHVLLQIKTGKRIVRKNPHT